MPVTALYKALSMIGEFWKDIIIAGGKAKRHREDSAESSTFGSVLGSVGMNIHTFEHTPPPKLSPNVSPDTLFGAR